MVFFHKKLTTRVAVIDAIVISILYILGFIFLPRILFLEILSGMVAGVAFSICFVYLIGFNRSHITGIELMKLGIVLSWLVIGCLALSRLYYFEFQINAVLRSYDTLFGSPVRIFAAICHIIAIGMIEDNLYRTSVKITAVAIFLGIFLVGLLKSVSFFLH